MKKINLAFCLLFFFVAALGQKQEPVNPQKDRQEFEGYIIRLLPAMSGTYGYDIFKGNERVLHQSRNPFTSSPIGLFTKKDAYKVAQWQIEQLKGRRGLTQGKPLNPGSNRTLSPALARRQLQSNQHTLFNEVVSQKIAGQLQIRITP